jgi:hypothetical protein
VERRSYKSSRPSVEGATLFISRVETAHKLITQLITKMLDKKRIYEERLLGDSMTIPHDYSHYPHIYGACLFRDWLNGRRNPRFSETNELYLRCFQELYVDMLEEMAWSYQPWYESIALDLLMAETHMFLSKIFNFLDEECIKGPDRCPFSSSLNKQFSVLLTPRYCSNS